MMGSDDVRLEIGDNFLLVEVEGCKAEVRGKHAADCKRIVARQLLLAISRVPDYAENERRNAERMIAEKSQYQANIPHQLAESPSHAVIGGLGAAIRNY